MADFWMSIGIILLLFFLGALFSAAEMSLVTLREAQVKKLSFKGKRGRAIERLTSNPNLFLSSVQIGVTLSGFMSSAFGSDSLANKYLGPWLASKGVPGANAIAIIVVTALISFFSIVLSELTAKRLALQRPEQFALALAPIVSVIATVCRPLIWLLGKCTNIMVRLLGGDPEAAKESVSEEELRSMVASAETLGDEERRIVDDVFDAGDRSLREVMVPRTEVDFLSADDQAAEVIETVVDREHSRYPVMDGSPDKLIGFLHVRDLMALDETALAQPIRYLVRPVLSLPETVKVLHALSYMRRKKAHLTIVLDEYGGTAGIVTLEDLLEEVIGEITDEYDVLDDDHAQHAEQHEVEGLTSLEDFEDKAHLVLPEGPYDTVAGFVMAELGRVAKLGDTICVELAESDQIDQPEFPKTRVRFTVCQMDGHRIAWVKVKREAPLDGIEVPSPVDDNERVMRQDTMVRTGLALNQHEEDLEEPGI